MLVKICGIQTLDAAKAAVEAGADFIGFVFAESSRRMTPKKAKEIAERIPPSVQKVGVFVNEDRQTIKNVAETVGLDIIQLHGDESPAFVERIPYRTIKALSIDELENICITDYKSDFYLIDSPPTVYRGGSGLTFDWTVIEEKQVPKDKLLLAGGLHPNNVQKAISIVQPKGVDVSSGVETNGEKDVEKIKTFIIRAKG